MKSNPSPLAIGVRTAFWIMSAAVAASLASPAEAALRYGNPTPEGVGAGSTPELVLFIWDPVAEVSYTKDLGINVFSTNYQLGNTSTNLFVYGQQDAGHQKLFDPLNTDASFLSFLARSTDKANQIWAVIAVASDTDNVPLAQDATSIYTTLNAQAANGTAVNPQYTSLLAWKNAEMVNAAGSFQTTVGLFNIRGGTCSSGCETDYAANTSSFNVKGEPAYVGDAFTSGKLNGSTTSPNVFNPVNKSSWFYAATSSSDDGDGVVTVDEFDNGVVGNGHDAYWGLGVDSNGNYILSYTMEASLTQAQTAQGQMLRLRTDFAANYGGTRFIGAPVGDTLNLGGGAAITPVPEPSTWGLMGLGLALLAGRARRQKNA